MTRMVQRVRAIGPRLAALVLAVIALAAALVYFGGREAGVGERSEAGTAVAQAQPVEAAQQGDGEGAGADASEEETDGAEPLMLTLSAPEICEAQHPSGGAEHGLEWNEEKQAWDDVEADAWWGWGNEGTVEVVWAASGGGGAYTVTIAGEVYTGASGTAEVSCALRHGPVRERGRHGRTYDNEDKPFVDSGLKTITATVTDGTGASAEATADVYVILSPEDGEHVLQSGETYRIRGWLVTVPEGVEIDWHRGVEESVCVNTRSDGTIDESVDCQKHFYLGWGGPGFYAWLSVGMEDGEESGRAIHLDDFDTSDDEEMAAATALHWDVYRKLSELAASIGQSPQRRTN